MPTKKTKDEVLLGYEKRLDDWKRMQQPVPDTRGLTHMDAEFVTFKLNPTKRKESREITRRLLEFMAESKIVTVDEIRTSLGITYPTIADRMETLRTLGLVRRELVVYYLATPRLYEFVEKHIDTLAV